MSARFEGGGDLTGLSLAAIALALVATALVVRGVQPNPKPNVQSQFNQLLSRYCRLWTSAAQADDPSKAAPLYAKDAGLVFFGLGDTEYKGWRAYGSGVKSSLLDNVMSLQFRPLGDLRVTRQGNFAWTTSDLQMAVTWENGHSQQLDVEQTAVWQDRGGHWLIVHEHLSSPALRAGRVGS
jgi:ketosteroid isomerase-like protein